MLQNSNNKTVKDFLSLDFGEMKMLALLFACDLIRRIASLLLETASSSIFLYDFDSAGLPYVFMITGFLTIFAAIHFIRVKKLPKIAAGINLMGLAIITLMFYLLYVFEHTEIASWGLMIWKSLCVLLSEIIFLLIALKFCKYDWRSWRFSAILMIEATALIASGLAVSVLVYFVTPITLVFISSVLLFIAGFMLYKLTKKMDDRPGISETHSVEGINHSPLQLGLVVSFFAMFALFILGSYLIEYLFYKGVYNMYGEWLADMTAFFALYHVFVGMLVFITVSAFRQFEWLRGLRFTPVTLSMFIFLAAGGCLLGSVWLLTFSRIGKNVLYKMLMTPTAKFFSVPLLPSLSKHLSAVRRIFIEPCSIFLAGVILLYTETYGTIINLAVILLIIGLAIAALAYLSYRLYSKVTFNSLNNRYWWGGSLFLEDTRLKELIKSEIINPDVASSIYYLRAIELSQNQDIENYFIYALNHPSDRVRLFAISRLGRMHSQMALPSLTKLIETDPSLAVQNRALQAYCIIGGSSVFSAVINYTKENTDLTKGATIGFLRSGKEGAFLAANRIGKMLDTGTKEDKIMTAEILGSAKSETYYLPLIPLLKDKSIEVRRAAVIAAGKIRTPKLTSELIAALEIPQLREDATESIIRLGQSAIPALSETLKDPNKSPLEARIFDLIGSIGGKSAMHILAESLNTAKPANRLLILKILNNYDWTLQTGEMKTFTSVLATEQERKHWLSVCIKDMSNSKSALKEPAKNSLDTLVTALKDEQNQSAQIISILKSIIHKYADIALTISLNAKTRPHKIHSMQYLKRLADIITFAPSNLHNWTTAAAIYLASQSDDAQLIPVITSALDHKNYLVRETALWALSKLLPQNRIKEIAKKYTKDDCKSIADLANSILT